MHWSSLFPSTDAKHGSCTTGTSRNFTYWHFTSYLYLHCRIALLTLEFWIMWIQSNQCSSDWSYHHGSKSHSQMPVVWRNVMWQKISGPTKETVQMCNEDYPLLVQDQIKWAKGMCCQLIALVCPCPLKKSSIKNHHQCTTLTVIKTTDFQYPHWSRLCISGLGLQSHLWIHWWITKESLLWTWRIAMKFFGSLNCSLNSFKINKFM